MPFEVTNAQGPATPVRVAAPTKFPISESGDIPVSKKTPFTSYTPVTFTVPNRPVALEIKVPVPAIGTKHPVILLSHGHGNTNFLSSLHGYGPLGGAWFHRHPADSHRRPPA